MSYKGVNARKAVTLGSDRLSGIKITSTVFGKRFGGETLFP